MLHITNKSTAQTKEYAIIILVFSIQPDILPRSLPIFRNNKTFLNEYIHNLCYKSCLHADYKH